MPILETRGISGHCPPSHAGPVINGGQRQLYAYADIARKIL